MFVGYYVDDRYAGQGLATEATQALSLVFENRDVQVVMADTERWAGFAKKVLQKNGFVFLRKPRKELAMGEEEGIKVLGNWILGY
ncbi:MAG: hypothetical protein R2825_24630 [Saprospiraceae bacterium]